MRAIPILLFCGCLAGCAAYALPTRAADSAANQETAGREGRSLQDAILIEEKTEPTGIAAEYRWLGEHFPGYKMKIQSLLFEGGKPYDLLEFVDAEGDAHAIYFDISNFFGKM